MKKIIAALLLSTAVAAPAFAADTGFYAGVTLGRSSTGTPYSNATLTKSTDTVLGVLGGYQFTKNWGAEAQYTGAGKFSGNIPGGTFTGKSDALSLAAVGTLPLNDSFSLYGKLGFASVKTTLTTSPASANTGASRTAATFGLGAQYNVTPAIGIRFGWDRYAAAVTGVGTSKYNDNVYSLGAVFKF